MTADQLHAVEIAYRSASTNVRELRAQRSAAVRAALASGMTHAEVARILGVSRGRVGQIAAGA